MATLYMKKMRLAGTHSFVAAARVAIDATNAFILYLTGPAQRRWKKLVGDAPWMGLILAGVCIQYLPATAVPMIAPAITPDTRRSLEQERVRAELQAGNDPYPYLTDRQNTYGATTPHRESRPEYAPRNAVPESVSVDVFRERRRKRNEEGLDDLDKQIVELEQKILGERDKTSQWIKTGLQRIG
jgi:hypothetical protein